MLSSEWRLQIQNETGVAFAASDTVTINGEPWNLAATTSGEPNYITALNLVPSTSGNSLANGAVASGTAQTSNIAIGAHCSISGSVSAATPDGAINVFFQYYDTVAGAWPANGDGELVAAVYLTATGAFGPIPFEIGG